MMGPSILDLLQFISVLALLLGVVRGLAWLEENHGFGTALWVLLGGIGLLVLLS